MRACIRNIDTAAQRAADLANQMLAYSGKGRFVIEPIDLSRLVEEMGHLLASVISKRAAVRYRLAAGAAAGQADATQIRQVVMNLITNASDAIGERGGVITVATGVVEVGAADLQASRRTRPAACAGDVRLPRGLGHRLRDGPGDPGADLRSLLHHQAHRPRAGAGRGARHRARAPRRRSGSTASPAGAPPSRCCCRRRRRPRRRQRRGAGAQPPGRGHPRRCGDHPARGRRGARPADDAGMLEESGYAVLTAADGVEGVELFREQAARAVRRGARHEHAAHGRRGGLPADAADRPRRARDSHQRLRRAGRRQPVHGRGPRRFHPEAVPDEGPHREDRGRDRRAGGSGRGDFPELPGTFPPAPRSNGHARRIPPTWSASGASRPGTPGRSRRSSGPTRAGSSHCAGICSGTRPTPRTRRRTSSSRLSRT